MPSLQCSLTRVMSCASLALLTALTACTGGQETPGTSSGTTASPDAPKSNLQGKVLADGSSTVFPIGEAIAEEFMKTNPGVNVTVGSSGTGGGFKKFCAGETSISNASRPIKTKEADLCVKGKVEFIEVPIAYDALSVVAHPENSWAKCLTTADLKKIWAPEAQGKIKNWKQVRPDFPDLPLALYGPGTDSGTFDYFTDAVNGKEGASRGDFTASEDDNVLVQGVSGSKGGLAYFGFAYYEENKDKLGLVAIDDGDAKNGEGCIEPSEQAVLDSTYQPLARPLFIYINKAALAKPDVKAFVDFALDTANKALIKEAGYIGLPDDIYAAIQNRVKDQKTGSVFAGGSTVGVKLSDILAKEAK